jgi:hypothetical protein
MTKPYYVPQKYSDSLALVTTISEAAKTWDRHRSTIKYAIDAENIVAVQSGATWLISVPSIQDFWGDPPTLPQPILDANSSKTPLRIIK